MNLVPTHSNCTSPMDYISHHALHSHIPVHHYTNHTAVTIHSSLWLPHHTCTSFSLSHKSSTQTLTQGEVLFCPGYISERSSLYLLSLCVTPDCPTFDLWTCACDLDPCLVLSTSLLCLWYSCFACWPLPVWFCPHLINIGAIGSARLRPLPYTHNVFWLLLQIYPSDISLVLWSRVTFQCL